MLLFEGDGQETKAKYRSSPRHLREGLGPGSLLLSRKHAELVCSSAQPPVSTGDGRVATRSLHRPFVVWPRNSSMSLPMSPVRGVLSMWGSFLAKPWSPLPFRLGEGAPPAMAAQYPAHIKMLNFFQLLWHHGGTYEVTVTTT